MLSNPGTPFDEDGWADALSDLRRLNLLIEGGSNDLNGSTAEVSQSTTGPSAALTEADVVRIIGENSSAVTPLLFDCYASGSLALGSGYNGYIKFNNILTDDFGNYSATTGLFTTTEAGYYSVSASVDYRALATLGGDSVETSIQNSFLGAGPGTRQVWFTGLTYTQGANVSANFYIPGAGFTIGVYCSASAAFSTLTANDLGLSNLSILRHAST